MDVAYGAPLRITEFKGSGDAWEVAGYASTFGNTDLGGDVVHKGAFAATLDAEQKVRFLYSHDPGQVLGTVQELKEDEAGLFGRFRISQTALGRDVHTLLKDGALDSFSIGYIPRDFDLDRKSGVRNLTAVDLLEVSVVAMPMNPQAVVTGVKADLPIAQVLEKSSLDGDETLRLVSALWERRRVEGQRPSDRLVALVEDYRQKRQGEADALLALLTTSPDPAADDVAAHLRRARLRELRHKFGLPPVDPAGAAAQRK